MQITKPRCNSNTLHGVKYGCVNKSSNYLTSKTSKENDEEIAEQGSLQGFMFFLHDVASHSHASVKLTDYSQSTNYMKQEM